mmetsp:Transcript_139581/g.446638  ORF Transcript_139581/g.446638 Transcript_139581/m.446638 type:complete len:205 (-) Transcript_139581:943-1557(-)
MWQVAAFAEENKWVIRIRLPLSLGGSRYDGRDAQCAAMAAVARASAIGPLSTAAGPSAASSASSSAGASAGGRGTGEASASAEAPSAASPDTEAPSEGGRCNGSWRHALAFGSASRASMTLRNTAAGPSARMPLSWLKALMPWRIILLPGDPWKTPSTGFKAPWMAPAPVESVEDAGCSRSRYSQYAVNSECLERALSGFASAP